MAENTTKQTETNKVSEGFLGCRKSPKETCRGQVSSEIQKPVGFVTVYFKRNMQTRQMEPITWYRYELILWFRMFGLLLLWAVIRFVYQLSFTFLGINSPWGKEPPLSLWNFAHKATPDGVKMGYAVWYLVMFPIVAIRILLWLNRH